MDDLSDIIEYEHENTNLDFKEVQYHKNTHQDFLKDIMSMANADSDETKFIIIGVANPNKEEKILKGINPDDFTDPSIYQQLIRENIEPDISLDYFLFPYKEMHFAVFKIEKCMDKPYQMKKEFGNLSKGEAWIRKGTHQARMIRRDYDAIYEKKSRKLDFKGNIQLIFDSTGTNEISLSPNDIQQLPSSIAEEEITKVIEEKRKNPPSELPGSISPILLLSSTYAPSPRSYQDLSIENLEILRSEIKEKLKSYDYYAFFEESSSKINLKIKNNGYEYIEDAYIEIVIPRLDGMIIAPSEYYQPKRSIQETLFPKTYDLLIRPSVIDSLSAMGSIPSAYPTVVYDRDFIMIKAFKNQIRHQLETLIFDSPIRLVIRNNLIGENIKIQCTIHGRNLPKPVMKELFIRIVE